MLKICGDSIYEPLETIFGQALTRVFPSEWKKRNIVPVHKKVTSKKYQKSLSSFSPSDLW